MRAVPFVESLVVAVIGYVRTVPFVKAFVVAVIGYVRSVPFVEPFVGVVIDHQTICKHIGTDTNEEQCQKEIRGLLHFFYCHQRKYTPRQAIAVTMAAPANLNHKPASVLISRNDMTMLTININQYSMST